MSKFTLNDTIKDFDFIERNFNFLLEEKYDNLVAQLLVEIGKTTSYDTGVIRDLIGNALNDLNRPDLEKELEHKVYEYWRTKEERLQDNSSYKLDMNFNKEKASYNLVINDDGFYNQQLGKVSTIHPRQDYNIIPQNVDYCIDKFETGSNEKIKEIEEDLINTIIKALEGDV